MSTRPRLAGAGLAVAAALLLSGCTGLEFGAAAQVGDETITLSTVDEATADLCTAFRAEFESNGQLVPKSYLRSGVVQILTAGTIAEDVADEYGVDEVPAHDAQVASLETSAASVPESARESYVEILSTESYVTGVAELAGRQALIDEGTASPSSEESLQRGQLLLTEWADSHDVEFDPRYGVTMEDGAVVDADTGLSLAVGEVAKAGQATEPDPAYAQGLPENHRCG